MAGVTLASGEEVDAGLVVTTAHPKISFLRLVDPAALPEPTSSPTSGAGRAAAGTVKINLALDRLPVFASHPAFDPQVHGGTIVLAESLDDIETAFQEAVSGRPSAQPFADICIPSVFDDSLAPAGHHVMSHVHPVGAACRVRGRAGRGRAGGLRRPGDRPDGGGRARIHRLGRCTGR